MLHILLQADADWLYIGSQVQAATDSLGTALAAMFVGAPLTIVLLARGLAWLDVKHRSLREARGQRASREGTLEVVMTVSAALAVLGFVVWFLVLQGPGPSLAPQS